MENNFIKNLNKILDDKTSGSSEILLLLNNFIINCKDDAVKINFVINEAEKKLKHFTAIKNYLNDIKSITHKNDFILLRKYLTGFRKKDELQITEIFHKIYKKLPHANNLITISRSGTIIKVLKLWHPKNKKLKVTILESRPAYEGRLTAKELLKMDINVQFATDAMMGMLLPKCDAAIVGADVVLKNGNVINKAGSKPLAVLCKYYKIPFYVLTTKLKFVDKSKYKLKEESARLIWDYKHPKLKIKNFPFEEIEKNLITSIITE